MSVQSLHFFVMCILYIRFNKIPTRVTCYFSNNELNMRIIQVQHAHLSTTSLCVSCSRVNVTANIQKIGTNYRKWFLSSKF